MLNKIFAILFGFLSLGLFSNVYADTQLYGTMQTNGVYTVGTTYYDPKPGGSTNWSRNLNFGAYPNEFSCSGGSGSGITQLSNLNPLDFEALDGTCGDGTYWFEFDWRGEQFYIIAYQEANVWTTVNAPDSATSTRIIQFTPITTTPTNTVTTTVQAFVNDSEPITQNFDSIEIQLTNYQTGFQYIPIILPLNASGLNTLATSTFLYSGGHQAIVSFYGANENGIFRYGTKSFLFSVVTNYSGSSTIPIKPECDPEDLFYVFCVAGNYFSDVLVWLFTPSPDILQRFTDLPSEINSKVPFVYFSQIANGVSESANASSSLSNFEVAWPWIHNGSTTSIPIFSTTIMEEKLGENFSTLARSMIGASMWIILAISIYGGLQNLIKIRA